MGEQAQEQVAGLSVLEIEPPAAGGPEPPDLAARVVLLGTERGIAKALRLEEPQLLRDGLLDVSGRRVELAEEALASVKIAHVSRVASRHG